MAFFSKNSRRLNGLDFTGLVDVEKLVRIQERLAKVSHRGERGIGWAGNILAFDRFDLIDHKVDR
jgi:hypothetical protein